MERQVSTLQILPWTYYKIRAFCFFQLVPLILHLKYQSSGHFSNGSAGVVQHRGTWRGWKVVIIVHQKRFIADCFQQEY